MFSLNHNHSFVRDNFKALHLNLDKNVYFYIFPDITQDHKFQPSCVSFSIDDFLVFVNTKISDNFVMENTEDKISFKFQKIDDKYKITTKYNQIYPDKSKIDIEVWINKSDLDKFIKDVYQQMSEVYEFERSCIDWTKNKEESKKADNLKKQIQKMNKLVEKL